MMTEKEYLELLKDLKLPANRSYQEIFDLLETVINDYMDRQDDAMVARINEAEEYVEEQRKLLGTGITIAEETEPQENTKVDLEILKGQQRTGGTQQFKASGIGPGTAGGAGGTGTGSTVSGNGVPGQTAGTVAAGGVGSSGSAGSSSGTAGTALWFTSLTGNAAVDNMFIQALDCMKYDQWSTADRIFDTIAGQEARNASAYLGKCLVNFQLKDPREIATSDAQIEQDVNFRKARDFGNNLQKKFLTDALQEKCRFMIYKDAYRKLQEKKNEDELSKAANLFRSLNGYQDADDKARECEELRQKLIYQEGAKALREKLSPDSLRAGAELFRRISGYKDADQLRDQCLALIPQLEGMAEKNQFLAQVQTIIQEVWNQAEKGTPAQFAEALQKYEDCLKELQKRKQDSELTALYDDVEEEQWEEEVHQAKRLNKKRFSQKRKTRRAVILVAVITFLIGPACYSGTYWANYDSVWLPISIIDTNLGILGISTPLVFSMGKVENVYMEHGEVGRFIMPFSHVDEFSVKEYEGETLAFPKYVDNVSIYDADNLQKLEIPEGVQNVSISSCESLKELELPNSVEVLEISHCPALGELVIPDSVSKITVYKCEKLEFQDGNIGRNVEELDLSLLPMVKEMKLPESVKTVKITDLGMKYFCVDQPLESLRIDVPEMLQVDLRYVPKEGVISIGGTNDIRISLVDEEGKEYGFFYGKLEENFSFGEDVDRYHISVSPAEEDTVLYNLDALNIGYIDIQVDTIEESKCRNISVIDCNTVDLIRVFKSSDENWVSANLEVINCEKLEEIKWWVNKSEVYKPNSVALNVDNCPMFAQGE